VGIYLVYFGPVDRSSLSHSVASAESVGSLPPFYAACSRHTESLWSCQLVTEEQSDSGGTYLVRRSGRCWTARQTAPGTLLHLPTRTSGCVGLFDQLRLSDRLGLGAFPPPPGYF
jgi:hypothetical protein